MPLPQPPQVVDLRLSLGSFSFTFLLAGVGTPRLESTRGKPGKPRLIRLIRSLCLDCSRWLPPCILHLSARTRWRYRTGGGSAGGGGSTMEFFTKAYAPGPSQLWLCSDTLLPSNCGPGRPALLTKTSLLSGTVYSVSPSVQPLFSRVLFSSLPLQSRAACGSSCEFLPTLCAQRLAVHLATALQGPFQGKDLGEQRVSGCPRPVAELDEEGILLFARLNSASNRAQRSQERIHFDIWPFGSSKQCLFMVHAGEVLKNTEVHVSR